MSRTGRSAAGGIRTSGPEALDSNQNFFLRHLPAQVKATWAPLLKPVHGSVGAAMFSRGTRVRFVHFPIDAVVAVMNTLEDDSSSLLMIIGNEGVIGLSAVMSGEAHVGEAVVQREGWLLQLEAIHFQRAFNASDEVRELTMRWLQATQIHIGQTAVCNRHHQAQQQICSILLRMIDRSDDTALQVTQDQLARMTGLRRETVSSAAARLQQLGVLSYRRGLVHVHDRAALEAAACSCYGLVEAVYRQLYFQRADTWGRRGG